ncbi:MAG: DUF6794 domain-containing protein [Synergistaceae bacterium]
MNINCATVQEAVEYLKKNLSNEDIEDISRKDERNMMASYHHSLGRWIRNTMGLWGGNKSLKLDCIKVMQDSQPEKVEEYSEHWEDLGESDFDYRNPECKWIHPDDASSVILKALWKNLHELPEG